MKIFIARWPKRMAEAELHAMFSQYGEVRALRLIVDPVSGEPRGFGFVEYSQQAPALAAIKALHNSLLGDRRLIVIPANNQKGETHEKHRTHS